MPFINYYDILQVSPNAHEEVIRSSYRTLMNKLNMHPDKGGDEEKAKIINEAYEVLSNPELRSEYDKQYFSKIDVAESNNNNGGISVNNGNLANNSWSSKPMTEKEINDIARAKLKKLVELDEFKDDLREFFNQRRRG